ncbi:MAG: XRE family transcriptional regulator [Magnetococcus sp. YQC-5]
MAKALIEPVMLRWARERASLSEDRLAQKLAIRVEQLLTWEKGTDFPTFRQAEKIAQHTHVPFGYLFLPAPPQEDLPIPDLRVQGGMPPEPPSADFFDLMRDVQFQHDWYRDYLLEQGAEPLPFVGKYRLTDTIETIARDIRTVLDMDTLLNIPDREYHLSSLCDRCEEIGIWIMRSGYIGSNTHRTLSVHEFRGFAISDDIVPLIFINGRDAKAAQLFTLAHELAHVWLGENGISNIRLDGEFPGPHAKVEQVCNAVAAELLTPRSLFLDAWQVGVTLDDNVLTLSKKFKVSGIVIARRALDLGKISRDQYLDVFDQEQRDWNREPAGKGGNPYATYPIKNGRKFTTAVLLSAMSGKLLLRDAGGLLHMKPATVQELFRRQHGERA